MKKSNHKFKPGFKLKCICCNKDITLIMLGVNVLSQGMWDGGIVGEIHANYGSNLDGDMYVIAVCDDCIKNQKEKSKVKYIGNYIFNEDGKKD
jgi:hypothetical protein